MNIRFAIPTYKRPGLIIGLTLGYLQRCGISNEDIDVFVSNEGEMLDYIQHNVLKYCKSVINASVNNVRDKFNYIHSYYPEGTNVVVVEDDIECIKMLSGYNKLTEVVDTFYGFCTAGFDLCIEHKTKLWGIASNNNPFFMKVQSGPCFKLIVANMYGFIAEKPPILITQYSKTDYERTILYTLKYGSVVRLDYLCPITKNYKNPGGMQELAGQQRAKLELDAVNYLATAYPDLCKANAKKESKYAELTLITKRIKPTTGGRLFDL